MSAVSAFIIFAYLAITVVYLHLARGGRWLVPLISAVHLFAAVFIVITSRGDYSNTDARLYYYDTQNFMMQGWGLSTAFVAQFTGVVTDILGATFEDMMLFYSLTGLIAVQLLLQQHLRILREAALPVFVAGFYLLPNLHFWTSPIGKDGPAVLGLAILAVFARDLRRYWRVLLLGLVIVTLVRPHIGFLALFAFGLSEMLSSRARSKFLFIVPLVLVGIVVARFAFVGLVGVDIFDPAAIIRFFSDRTTFITTGYNDAQVQYISNPALRVFGFLLLPLTNFGGLLPAVASLENIVFAAVLGRTAWVCRSINFLRDAHARFLLISFLGIVLLVGLANWNVGLGLRQKTMLYPSLVTLLLLGEIATRRRRDGKGDNGAVTSAAVLQPA